MYRVDGTSDLDEEMLDHFEGSAAPRPVRIGNGAADQLQLDIYGEAMDSICLADQHGIRSATRAGQLVPDHRLAVRPLGPARRGHLGDPRRPQDFTYGRLMSWVAFDRAIRLARDRGRPADLARWTSARDAIYHQIMERGWNAEARRFVQHDHTDVLDASLLLMPLVGFVAPRTRCGSRRWTPWTTSWSRTASSTATTPAPPPTACAASEGTFSICTFWYVDALARSGGSTRPG